MAVSHNHAQKMDDLLPYSIFSFIADTLVAID